MPGPNQISVAQLARLIGTADAPAVFDVRVPEDIAADPRVIPTARQIAPHTFAARATELAADLSAALAAGPAAGPAAERVRDLPGGRTGGRAVVVCQRGRKLSEGAAALLRCHGVDAQTLEGGTEAWVAAGLPLVPLAALPGPRLWVTRHRPKIDRIACPWLIRRFIDPSAQFLFVTPAEVPEVAQRFDATAFDIEGAFWSHRGDGCTFDTMIDEWGLTFPALARLALVVRAADTDQHHLSPQAAGLLAISVGLSRLYRDDLAQLDAGMALYDALYRWARDGFDEGHDWPASAATGGPKASTTDRVPGAT